jgi:hypothetical protein
LNALVHYTVRRSEQEDAGPPLPPADLRLPDKEDGAPVGAQVLAEEDEEDRAVQQERTELRRTSQVLVERGKQEQA